MRKKIVASLVTGLFMIGMVGMAQADPVQWKVADGGNDHWYEAVLSPGIDWNDANQAALARTGNWYLVTITSQSENDFILDLFENQSAFWSYAGHSSLVGDVYAGPWIGGQSSSDNSNDWSWETGESFSFTAWGPYEPFRNGDRIYLSQFGSSTNIGWNDAPNDYAAPGFVVETDAVPGGQSCQSPLNQFAWSYPPAVNPIMQSNPATCKPFAVGDLASGNLNLQIGLPVFSSGVDVYLAIGFGDTLFLIDGSNGLQPAVGLTALPRWKTNLSSAIDESLYGNIPTSLLSPGVYNFYLLVVPTGETDFSHYYFWATSFDYLIDSNNIDNDGDGFTENQGDCKDDDLAIFPGATEICGDGIDQDCNGSDEVCPLNYPDISGSYKITTTVNATDCGEGIYTYSSILLCTQNGNNVILSGSDYDGDPFVLTGTLEGDRLFTSGSYKEGEGTTNLTANLTLSGSGFNGSISWTWINGYLSCSGSDVISGIKQ